MHRMHGTKESWLAALRAEGAAFHAVVQEADGAAPVPSCPEWTVERLTAHLGCVHAWVAEHVRRGVTSAPQPLAELELPVPAWPETAAWARDQYTTLLSALDRLDPEQPAWNWAPQPKRAAFWHRRMAHETTVHRWDAQLAAGRPEPVEAKLAADGVAEVLDTWLPAGRRRGPADRHGVVHLAATDIAEEWYVRLRGAGLALLDTDTLLDSAEPHARVAARGTASDLLLAMWGRVPFDVLDVTGQPALLPALRAG
ncbi:MAG TPA: maleylpyruvate isomerase family mycothiol-dependent enzyme [Pilimelia sp.]|nr:maleylpyruvate isomerase family mycothiol-dependent enzyme [Pilimelia sp.]